MVDSLQRQFLLKYKNLFNFSELEREIKCPEKTISRYVAGKHPLPDKWYPVLRDFLKAMCDEYNESHKSIYQTDMVIVLERDHLSKEYETLHWRKIKLDFFEKKYVTGASVVYFREKNKIGTYFYTSIYSAYTSSKV